MPPLSDLTGLLEQVWATKIVTNEGPLHNRLEAELASLLRVPTARLFCNGTAALQVAILSLNLPAGSEIITSPLTFAATAHAITASGFHPIFADVDEHTLTLDPRAVERAISDKTGAVIGVHVYGTLCDHRSLRNLCSATGLKLIYDAAHAFGAVDNGTPVGQLGDMSMFSLHATKLFNTFEGGLLTTNDPELGEQLRLIRNFGIVDEETVSTVGINAKMGELHAAVGLANLKYFRQEQVTRRNLRARYDEVMARFPGVRVHATQPGVESSEQYYMVRIDPEVFGATRDDLYNSLKERNIYSRRYFWPICTDFECYRDHEIVSISNVPVTERIKNQVLCLPFHSGVEQVHISIMADVFEKARREADRKTHARA